MTEYEYKFWAFQTHSEFATEVVGTSDLVVHEYQWKRWLDFHGSNGWCLMTHIMLLGAHDDCYRQFIFMRPKRDAIP